MTATTGRAVVFVVTGALVFGVAALLKRRRKPPVLERPPDGPADLDTGTRGLDLVQLAGLALVGFGIGLLKSSW